MGVAIAVTVAAMFVITALAVICFPAADDSGNDDVLGAPTVDITGHDATWIKSNVESACGPGVTVLVTGSATVTATVAIDMKGADVIWEADITAPYGIEVTGGGTFTKTVGASWTVDWFGIYDSGTPPKGGRAILNGNLTFEGNDNGTGANGANSTLIINGNVTSGWEIGARFGGMVIMKGDLTVTGGCVYVSTGGTIFINGKLTVPDTDDYLTFDTAHFSIDDRENESSVAGYYDYTDNVSRVFIKIPEKGNNAALIVAVGMAAVIIIGVLFYFYLRKKQ